MKYFILIFITTVLFLTACEDAIDIAPISQSSVANFYKSAEDIEQGVIAAYDALQLNGQYRQNFVYFMEVRSDNSVQSSITNSGGVYGDFDLFRLEPTNGVLSSTWRDCYEGIQRCNIVLNRIDDVDMDANLRTTRKGELRFLRALTYFNLVRIWNDVPLITTETTDPFDAFEEGRDNADLVYDQIVADLTAAVNELPVQQTEPGRATKGAAQALLAKAHMTLQNFDEASNLLKSVIASGAYELLPDYEGVFDVNNENNAESVFEVQFTAGGIGEGSPFTNLFTPFGAAELIGGVGQTFGDNRPTQDLYDTYGEGDLRRDATIGIWNGESMYTKKYLSIPFDDRDADNNFIVMRYADVLLMAAEALNEQGYAANGEAFTYLNMIRTRAGLPILTSVEVPNQASFRLAVEEERRLELAFENHRWFDLLRTGRALEVMNNHESSWGPSTVQPHQLLFPVPQREIDASAGMITQNQGY